MLPGRIPSSTVVKSTVRDTLKGRWTEAVVVGLLPVFCYYIFNMLLSVTLLFAKNESGYILVAIGGVSAFLILLPLFYGVLRWFWRATDGAIEDISSAFYYFMSKKAYVRAVKLSLVICFKAGVIVFLCMIPYFAVQILSHFWLYDIFKEALPVWAVNISAFKNLFYVFGILLATATSLRYYLVPIIAVMDDDLLILEAVHISTTLSKKSLSAFFNLLCSNIGWIFLSLLVLPLIYTAPFLIGCYVVHSRFTMVNYNQSLDFYEKNRFNSYFKV